MFKKGMKPFGKGGDKEDGRDEKPTRKKGMRKMKRMAKGR